MSFARVPGLLERRTPELCCRETGRLRRHLSTSERCTVRFVSYGVPSFVGSNGGTACGGLTPGRPGAA
jgi:hypothetical protein